LALPGEVFTASRWSCRSLCHQLTPWRQSERRASL
jgi:hypothetical protein